MPASLSPLSTVSSMWMCNHLLVRVARVVEHSFTYLGTGFDQVLSQLLAYVSNCALATFNFFENLRGLS